MDASWPHVDEADGYRLYYAPYPDGYPVRWFEMAKFTSLSIEFWENAAFYVALKSYKNDTFSNYSNIKHFVLQSSIGSGISVSDIFPVDNNLNWYYNHVPSIYQFIKKDIDNVDVNAFTHPTGIQEYFTLNANTIMLHGMYLPSFTATSSAGDRQFQADIRFYDPFIFFSNQWNSGTVQSVSGEAYIHTGRPDAWRIVTYNGTLEYHGVESIEMPAGQYQAHHITLSCTFVGEVSSYAINIPHTTQFWLAENKGIVKRIDDGIVHELSTLTQ